MTPQMPAIAPVTTPRMISDAKGAGALFAPLLDEPTEVVAFAYLAGDGRLLGMRHVRSPHPDMLDLPMRDIAADAIALGAAAMVMAHNHPSGDPAPSIADREATRLLVRMLEPMGVRLLEHLVLGRDGVTSFRALGLL